MSAALTAYTTSYPAVAEGLPGNALAELQAIREDAFAQFSAHGFPATTEEDWRYTNLSALQKKAFIPALSGINPVDADWLESYQLADAWSLVLVDGHFRADLSVLAGLPEAVTIMPMVDALAQHAEQVMPYLGKALASAGHGFIAFNTAWFTDGLWVNIPDQQVLEKPIQCLHVVTQEGNLASTRNLLVLGQNAAVQWLETFIGSDDVGYLSVAVTEAFIGQNAQLTAYKIQCESAQAFHFGGLYIQQAPQACCTHHNFAFGGLLARSDIHTDLHQAAQCELNGLYLGVKRQHIDNHTRINHNQPDGISRETYKGVLADRARGVFQGRVVVAEQAQKIDSNMSNRNLLLSADAEVDTKPQLEIYADDVKCGHGMTVGQLDEKSVFYLQSRGIDEVTARNMLTFAFANEMADKITLPALKALLLGQLLVHFPQHGYVD